MTDKITIRSAILAQVTPFVDPSSSVVLRNLDKLSETASNYFKTLAPPVRKYRLVVKTGQNGGTSSKELRIFLFFTYNQFGRGDMEFGYSCDQELSIRSQVV
jgi:hypothetical protein